MQRKKWYDVYPSGTQAGNEEQKFFIALARHPKYSWRSVSAIAKASGLTEEICERIINKYYKKGIVIQNPKNENHWGYWERNKDVLDDCKMSMSNVDKKERIEKAS